jgi:hypothetical protein
MYIRIGSEVLGVYHSTILLSLSKISTFLLCLLAAKYYTLTHIFVCS